MAKCEKCGKRIGLNEEERVFFPENTNDQPISCCLNCYDQLMNTEGRKRLEEVIANAPQIKCPFCEQWFPKLTNEQYRESAELNVLRWAIVPAWGVVGALKNKPFIECPHCKMKIMQG